MKNLILSSAFLLLSMFTIGQATIYLDPAESFQKLMLSKTGSTMQQIGNWKVKGTSFLYGGSVPGDVYFRNGNVKNVMITYDTYKQIIALHVGNEGKSLVKQLDELDSFILKADENTVYRSDLRFINAGQIDSSKKVFLQVVYTGPKFTLYKAYRSSLEIPNDNYAQLDLREFDLNYEYFYSENKNPGLKKLKTTPKGVKKEFKNVKDVSAAVDTDFYNSKIESGLIKAFELLNKD